MKAVKLFPKNPYVLSKAGRFCLEAGRKSEAVYLFNKVRGKLQEMTKKQPKVAPTEGINIESVLG